MRVRSDITKGGAIVIDIYFSQWCVSSRFKASQWRYTLLWGFCYWSDSKLTCVRLTVKNTRARARPRPHTRRCTRLVIFEINGRNKQWRRNAWWLAKAIGLFIRFRGTKTQSRRTLRKMNCRCVLWASALKERRAGTSQRKEAERFEVQTTTVPDQLQMIFKPSSSSPIKIKGHVPK